MQQKVQLLQLLLAAMFACIVAQRPNTNFTTAFTANAFNANLTLRVGDNVSFACSFSDKQWSVHIVRFHPDKNQLKDGSRRTLPLVNGKSFSGELLQLLQQFPELAKRLTISYDDSSSTAYFKITDFQYEDAGDFGCYASSGLQVSQISTISLDSNDKVVYVDINGTQQQVIEPSALGRQIQLNCSLYHVRGLQNAADLSSFRRCSLFDAQGAKLNTSSCTSDSLPITEVGRDNFTDPYRYGEFWPRSFERTVVQTTLTLDQSYYNKSIGCFASRNQDKSVSDFVTMTKPGVDLHLDPANFQCTPHHVQKKQNEYAEFSCNVTEPVYRKFHIYWIVEIPPSNANPPKTLNCAASTSCKVNDVVIEDPKNVSSNAYVNIILAKARIRVTSTTSQYKLRLAASYLETKTFISDDFTIKIPPVSVDTGAVKGAAGAVQSSLWSLAVVVLLALFNL